MIIGNDDFNKGNPQSRPPYLISETEIQAVIGGLRINKSYDVTLRLATAALAIVEMMQNRIEGKSNKANLLLIKQISQEHKNKQYQRLMDAVIDAIEPDKERFSSAFHTLTRALEFAHSSSPVYSSAREFYEERMSKIREEESEG